VAAEVGGNVDDKTLKLLDAILEAYDQFHEPKNGETFCNLAVFHVLKCLGIFDQLRDADGSAMMADQMIDAMRRSPAWQSVSMEMAQPLANEGQIVVAGMTSAEMSEKNGHVVVVRPGLPELSGKWAGYAPKVSHCGFHPLIGSGAEWAFPGKVRPGFWLLKSQGGSL
jgi:hypothetical protein